MPKAPPKYRRSMLKVSDQTFINIWNTCNCQADVAGIMNTTPGSCKVRAVKLRRAGYDLKEFGPPVVSDEDFMRAWNAAGSVAEVVAVTGQTSGSCKTRACAMRKRGLPIKSFKMKKSNVA